MSAADDRADVEKVLAGDFDSFENIVRRWQGPLINLAFRFCRDRSRAEELAQEAFLRAHRGLRGWRREAAFSTWLFALALNLYRSDIRRLPPPDFSGWPAADHSADDRDEIVHRAVLALPPKYRDPIVMFYFQDMDLAATAIALGMPEGTLKARLHRGREILRKKLPQLLSDLRFKEVG